jgi:hypothetical protein
MSTQQTTTNKAKPSPESYVARYVRYDSPSNLPSLLVPWTATLAESRKHAERMNLTLAEINDREHGSRLQIKGAIASIEIREHEKPPTKAIRLQDQFCMIELENMEAAYRFMNAIISNCEKIGHQIEYVSHTQKSKHFVIRTKDGYTLYVCSSANYRLPDVSEVVDLFIHWRPDFHDPRKRKSDRQTTDSNLFDSATIAG